jgi:NTE family protein
MDVIQQQSGAAVTGLVLSGGGARAAYQAGVLAAIAELLPDAAQNPFPVIVGTSAGAINAVGLASGALHFGEATRRIGDVWRSFHCEQIYRTDWPGLLRQASRFFGFSLLGLGPDVPVALLDSSPLRSLLERELDCSGIAAAIRLRQLRAVAVTAFSYDSGQAVTFYQGRANIDPWLRHRRIGVPTRLGVDHLLASSAIPLVFPPVWLNREYYGDGAVRQTAPISPVLHLGATRALVIGVSDPENDQPPAVRGRSHPPNLARIGAHLLNSAFTDNLEMDIELLERLNRIGRILPDTRQTRQLGLRPVDVLVINPSESLDRIATRHRHTLPRSLRTFLRGPGATKVSGAGVLSYLLFEPAYCNELIELGYKDAMARKEALRDFLGLRVPQPAEALA